MDEVDKVKTARYWAIVPAAGAGRRMAMDIPKQYLDIQGRPLIAHTLTRLLEFPLFEKIVVLLNYDDDYHQQLEILQHEKIELAPGGRERCYSVMNGLRVLMNIAHRNDWVMVHDVVRPCVRQSDLEWLVNQLQSHSVGGLLGVPMTDTLKQVNAAGEVEATVNRDRLWHALTPQMFRLGLLHDALEKAINDQFMVTDEASAVEYLGLHPMMLEGHSDNIKVTRGADLALASLYLEQQAKLIEGK